MPQDPDPSRQTPGERSRESASPPSSHGKPTLWQLVVSILGAALGVQSSKVREQDFQSSSPMPYIIGGIIFGAVFVGLVALAVTLVLKSAGQ